MSKVNLNFKVINTTSTHTLLCGDVDIIQPTQNSIICPPLCDYQDNHIILDRTIDKYFKAEFMKAPVLNRSFTIYDQAGFTNTKYNISRVNNNSGTIDNEIEPRVLLSDIVLPQIGDGQQFLIITSYSGFTNRYLDEQKKYTIINDLSLFQSKYDLSKVILFVVETLYEEMIKYCDLQTIFKQVYVKPIQKMVPSFVEFIAGSIVSGSKPDFQTFISFGQNVEIAREYFYHDKNQLSIHIRRGQKIHLATTFTTKSNFLILLAHSSPNDIKITESTNNTVFDLVKIDDDQVMISKSQIKTVIDAILYLNELEELQTREEFTSYMYANSDRLVTYLIDSPIQKMFKYDKSLSELDLMIYNYMQQIQSNIYDKLINYSYSHELFNQPKPSMLRQITDASTKST